jgi:hypothetical protein
MELYRLVNTAFAGEPEHIALQKVGGFDILQFTEIDKISEISAGVRDWDPNEDVKLLIDNNEQEFYIDYKDDQKIIYVG